MQVVFWMRNRMPTPTDVEAAEEVAAGAAQGAPVPPPVPPPERLSTWQSIALMFKSWRLASVALQSFASGLPLGLVWIAIPTWMTQAGVDIKVVGLFTLAQAPWSFKFLWSPLMDRYPPPLLGRKRGWIFVSQLALLGFGLWLGFVSDRPEAVGVIGALALAIGLAAATQDIAIDAYAVEVLRKEEQGAAVGARTAIYRAAMFLSGGLSITLAAMWSWTAVNILLALVYVPMLVVTWRSPEPEVPPKPPSTLKDAVWGPFVGFLAQHRALEILAFVILYKLSDNLTQALTRPFLVQTGFSAVDVGVVTGTIGLVATLVGTFLGGLFTNSLGLGRALWVFGFLQILSNLGYAVVAQVGNNRPIMYAAVAFELASTGLGSGAFGVLLLRMTQKRFSATQYALFSSLFAISRILAGPPAGLLADTLGWRNFFLLTVPTGLPGLIMLARFVPWNVRELEFEVQEQKAGRPLSKGAVLARALAWGLASWVLCWLTVAALWGMRSVRAKNGFRFFDHLWLVLDPSTLGGWSTFVGLLVIGVSAGLMTAATLVARRGLASPVASPQPL
jgi:MFS transporter, PAT family, beta-lactamase induction signal transducer AmpG